jgi:hypothetical protein
VVKASDVRGSRYGGVEYEERDEEQGGRNVSSENRFGSASAAIWLGWTTGVRESW